MAANSNTPEIEEVFKKVKEKINTDFNLELIEQGDQNMVKSINKYANEELTNLLSNKSELIKMKNVDKTSHPDDVLLNAIFSLYITKLKKIYDKKGEAKKIKGERINVDRTSNFSTREKRQNKNEKKEGKLKQKHEELIDAYLNLLKITIPIIYILFELFISNDVSYGSRLVTKGIAKLNEYRQLKNREKELPKIIKSLFKEFYDKTDINLNQATGSNILSNQPTPGSDENLRLKENDKFFMQDFFERFTFNTIEKKQTVRKYFGRDEFTYEVENIKTLGHYSLTKYLTMFKSIFESIKLKKDETPIQDKSIPTFYKLPSSGLKPDTIAKLKNGKYTIKCQIFSEGKLLNNELIFSDGEAPDNNMIDIERLNSTKEPTSKTTRGGTSRARTRARTRGRRRRRKRGGTRGRKRRTRNKYTFNRGGKRRLSRKNVFRKR